MSVIRRCPTCGTTQAISGECEACHEAEVRYYCTNHTPGVWLDGTSCPHCGARLGASPREKSTAPPPIVRRPAPAPVPTHARAPVIPPRPSSRPPLAPAPLPAKSPPPPRDMGAAPIDYSGTVDTYAAGAPAWQRMLEAVLRARVARRERDRIGGGAARNLSGCLRRLVLVAVVLFFVLIAAVFLFGRAFIQGIGP